MNSAVDKTILSVLKKNGALNYTKLREQTGHAYATIQVHILNLRCRKLVTIRQGGWQNPSNIVEITAEGLQFLENTEQKNNGCA